MTITAIAPAEEVAHAEGWRQWQLAYRESSRRSGARVRMVFTVILTALAIALGGQLLR